MKRYKVLYIGVFFLLLGIVFLIISGSNFWGTLLGVIEFSIGAITLNAYNCDKIRYLKTIQLAFQREGYVLNITMRKFFSYLIVGVLFMAMAFLWGYLEYKGIIQNWIFNLVGGIICLITLLQMYIGLSKPTDQDLIEFKEIINQLLMSNKE